jgi:lipopolysaccharide export system protein LptA
MYQARKQTAKRLSRLLLLAFFFPLISVGLPKDKSAPVHIIADSSIYNYKTGVNHFDGHVKVDQGTTHLTADRLITLNNDQHKMQMATAYGIGELAHYWTLPKVGDPEVHAHAKIIKFYPIESNVTLEQDVVVTQGENSFQGQLIHYNSNEQTITVPALDKSRAVLVYNPDK